MINGIGGNGQIRVTDRHGNTLAALHKNKQNDPVSRMLQSQKRQTESAAQKEARKKDPVLDQLLYQQDKSDMMSDQTKIRNILRKLARGESLTPEEQQMVQQDQELAQQAQKVKQERQMIEQQLKNASKEEADAILNTTMTASVKSSSGTGDAGQDAFEQELKGEMVATLRNEYGEGKTDTIDDQKDKRKHFTAQA